ncbi:hypothetical protein [Streptomyces sp. HUAS ZL42]|uniref:hypothetical protein n=1 Tax=Streptomyces sp. HUAS ZL42 TaxID=3231715 RepID=UPI00345F14C2
MAVVIGNLGGILQSCETRLASLVFLIFARGDWKEAATAAAEVDKAVADLLLARPGKIRKKDADGVWGPASDGLALRSWLWFVIAALLAVGTLLLGPSRSDAEWYVRIAMSLVPALPSALFVSREIGHVLTRRALGAGRAGRNRLVWISRWLSPGAVLVLAGGMWVLWMMVFVI